jgi:hypothetical protein
VLNEKELKMKTLLIVLALLALSASAANAQTKVNINVANLSWQWTQGATPNAGIPEEFRVKCGQSAGVYSKVTTLIGSLIRSVAVRTAIGGNGSWYCVVTAWDDTAGESGPSNEVFFSAGEPASSPTNLIVK